ncbi:MAG: LEA type 2 family protein [Cyclobacteriaceae bacterium]|nr:LEA type 2 family protein [Cyclobacteriaceae bacterium]
MWSKSLWLVVLVLLTGCVPEEQVVLRAIDNVELAPGKGADLVLKADARFYNPNKIRMKVKAIELDVFIDGKKSARVDQKLKSVIKSQAEFTLPLEVQLSMKEIGLVDALLGLFGGKKYLINYKGHIKVTVRGFPLRIPVDYSKEVRLRI